MVGSMHLQTRQESGSRWCLSATLQALKAYLCWPVGGDLQTEDRATQAMDCNSQGHDAFLSSLPLLLVPTTVLALSSFSKPGPMQGSTQLRQAP